jgi:RNA polymerase sigma factor FliA
MTNLVEEHLGYAAAIAAEILKKLPPHVDRADVESAAKLGLVQAARAFDPTRGIPFTTFAYYRIRGAIYDDLRQSRRAVQVNQERKFEEAANEFMTDYLSGKAAGAPTYSGISSIVSGVATTYLLSLESVSHEPASRNGDLPVDTLIRQENHERLHRALAGLPKRNREVVQAYYFEDLSLEQIGRRHGLSKSWVSRIHARSIQLLREAMSSEPAESGAILPAALLIKQSVHSQP